MISNLTSAAFDARHAIQRTLPDGAASALVPLMQQSLTPAGTSMPITSAAIRVPIREWSSSRPETPGGMPCRGPRSAHARTELPSDGNGLFGVSYFNGSHSNDAYLSGSNLSGDYFNGSSDPSDAFRTGLLAELTARLTRMGSAMLAFVSAVERLVSSVQRAGLQAADRPSPQDTSRSSFADPCGLAVEGSYHSAAPEKARDSGSTSGTSAGNAVTSSSNSTGDIEFPKGGRFLWKPVSERDRKLVVLLPKDLSDAASVQILSPDRTSVLDSGKLTGIANGDRAHFRFSAPGSSFPDGSIVRATYRDGSIRQLSIPETSSRFAR